MKPQRKSQRRAASVLLGLALSLSAGAHAQEIRHVLLVSVDGMHALDVPRYVEGHPGSALAQLSNHGVT